MNRDGNGKGEVVCAAGAPPFSRFFCERVGDQTQFLGSDKFLGKGASCLGVALQMLKQNVARKVAVASIWYGSASQSSRAAWVGASN